MTDELNNTPAQDAGTTDTNGTTPPRPAAPPPPASVPEDSAPQPAVDDRDPYEERLERLGGEPAPVITPEEFARLQRAGQVHIDARGRVRTNRRSDAEAGVSLRKRRAWYA